jgi:hypothetical protein
VADNKTIEPPVTIKAGQIQFIEACHPALVAGEYAVRTTQQIKDAKDATVPWNSNPYSSDVVFSVDAPRYTLGPETIHSVYPPVNELGRFDNSLPHVVFTRRTLPWERTLDGVPPQLGEPFPPWMALLLLQEDELQSTGDKGQVKSLPVLSASEDSLLRAASPDVLTPDVGQNGPGNKGDAGFEFRQIRSQNWQQEKWRYEAGGQLCLAIDLPARLFKAVAPRSADLPYLAHVRQVDTGNKEVLGINDKGWFSLVLGNRLPQANKGHRVFLVSLEGFQGRLEDSWNPVANQKVRLAVLCAWNFTCEGPNDFKQTMDSLNFGRNAPPPGKREDLPESGLRLSFNAYDDDSLRAEDVVNAAYARGYTAFDHFMRQGEKTVSWYRGPLVPLNYTKPKQIQEPVANSDELLRYDPETGLFDTTYAASWQIGRLLALQNHGFALALDQARRALRQRAETLLRHDELTILRHELGLPDKDFLEDSLMEHFAGDAGKKLLL